MISKNVSNLIIPEIAGYWWIQRVNDQANCLGLKKERQS